MITAAMAGPLPNRKHEIFAVELATGAPLEAAYVTAGYKPGRAARYNASRLRNTPVLRNRIQELFAAAAKDAIVGINWVQLQLIDIIQGKAPAKIKTDGKGEKIEEIDRLAALVALMRSLGITDSSISVSAQAAAGFAPDITDEDRIRALSSLLARRQLEQPAPLSSHDIDEMEAMLARR